MMKKLKILVLEAYYGGSHKRFLDELAHYSIHDYHVLGLPDSFWRWRMRHSAGYFADECKKLCAKDFDLILASDMTNLAEFRGLAPTEFRSLPLIAYFHENQLFYPVHDEKKRDNYAILNNFSTMLASDAVWFNSAHNRDSFLDGLPDILNKMPDFRPLDKIAQVRAKARIMPLGIDAPKFIRGERDPDAPLHILWAARWQYDKNPRDFFAALRILKKHDLNFKISVLGESVFRREEKIFASARQEFADNIENFGFVAGRSDYLRILGQCDVLVSTAIHEFFGLSVLEAASYGAVPVLPRRLSYPEIFACDDYFYGQSAVELAAKLQSYIAALEQRVMPRQCVAKMPEDIAGGYCWDNIAQNFDKAFAKKFA